MLALSPRGNFFNVDMAACFLKQAKTCEASTSKLFTERCLKSKLRISHFDAAICVIPMTKSILMIHDLNRKSYLAAGEEKLPPKRFVKSAYDRFSYDRFSCN